MHYFNLFVVRHCDADAVNVELIESSIIGKFRGEIFHKNRVTCGSVNKMTVNLLGYLNVARSTSTGKASEVNELWTVMVSLTFVAGPRSLALREEYRLIMFDNGVRMQIFGYEREEVVGSWRNFIMKNSTVFTVNVMLLG